MTATMAQFVQQRSDNMDSHLTQCVFKELVHAQRTYFELWMHAGSLENTKEREEVFEATAVGNSSFLSALEPSQAHP